MYCGMCIRIKFGDIDKNVVIWGVVVYFSSGFFEFIWEVVKWIVGN